MTDKKTTNAEIIKALELFKSGENENFAFVCGNALDQINRYEREIEAWKYYYNECLTDLKNAHAEIEKIKKDLKYYLDTNEENGVVYIPKFIINNLLNVKENNNAE